MIERTGPGPTLHRVVKKGDLLFISGLTAEDKSGDMYAQTKDIAARLDKALASVGSDKTKILSCTIYITDFDAKDKMNKAWQEWLSPGDMPARATIGVNELGPKTLIEITTIASV